MKFKWRTVLIVVGLVVAVVLLIDFNRRMEELNRAFFERVEQGYRAIAAVKVGGRVSDIGDAVQRHVEAHGCSVVREFVGHGIGTAMHEEPQVPNYGPAGRGARLTEGMVLAIEPMVNAGGPGVETLDDGWTAVTADGRLSAHFEHTVAVSENGPEILTLPEGVAFEAG